MQKLLLVLLFFSLTTVPSVAWSIVFTANDISTSADGARSVYTVDIENDGDTDVLSASWLDDKISWYKNDGSENFVENIITTSADGAYSVYAIDIDGDGDTDVLSASMNDDKIAWYEQKETMEIDSYQVSQNYYLYFNYRNPFNPITNLRYDISEQAQVTPTVFDLMERQITQLINTTQESGYKFVKWNAIDFFLASL